MLNRLIKSAKLLKPKTGNDVPDAFQTRAVQLGQQAKV